MTGLETVVILVLIYAMAWYMATNERTLRDNGWVLYVKSGCIHCTNQLNSIGWKKYFLKIIDCASSPLCKDANVVAYPTWVNNTTGQSYAGTIPYEVLVDTLQKAPLAKDQKLSVDMATTVKTQ